MKWGKSFLTFAEEYRRCKARSYAPEEWLLRRSQMVEEQCNPVKDGSKKERHFRILWDLIITNSLTQRT